MKTSLFSFLFLVVVSIIFHSGCADNINNPSGSTSVNISKPLNNDTISFRNYIISYDLINSGGIKYIELYINGNIVKSYKPNTDGTKPIITIDLDTSYINKRISYQLKCYDVNTYAESPVISNVYVTEEKIAPFIPFNIKIKKISDISYNISWQDSSSGQVGHEIWRKEDTEDNFSLWMVAVPGVSNINDEYAPEGKVYFYKIRGYNNYGFSDFSQVYNTSGGGGSSQILAPKLLSISVLSTKTLLLNWQDNSTNENYFSIERKLTWSEYSSVGFGGRNATSFKDSGNISAGTEYTYRIKAYSGTDSSWSNELTIVVPYYVLSAPTLTSITNPASNKVVLKWKDNDNHQANWLIERKLEPSGDYYEIGEVESYLTTYDDKTVEINKTYTYRLRSYDQNGFSPYSNELGLTTAFIPLTVPDNITLKYFAFYAVEIKWTLSDPNVTKVLIERRLNTEPLSAYKKVAEVETYQTSYYDTGTLCQKTYVYRLRSTDGKYYSNISPEYVITNTDNCK